jgi:hypothetical protein
MYQHIIFERKKETQNYFSFELEAYSWLAWHFYGQQISPLQVTQTLLWDLNLYQICQDA